MPSHLDQQLRLNPASYLLSPAMFGTARLDLPWHIPPGGDEVSLRVAQVQHALVAAWEARGRCPSAAILGRRYRVSKQTLSRVCRGRRWAGSTVMAALADAVFQPPRAAPPRRPS